ncbi:MAG: enoyl-CoA hydratase/isomerase family protein [Acidimicrobiales bacterium]
MIDVTDNGSTRIVTFDRPEVRNAFNFAMYRATTEALSAASADDGVRTVVLTGRPPAFTSGQDLAEMAEIAAGTAPAGVEQGFRGLLDAVGDFDKPLLAAVNGVGVGLGFTILGHCDLVLVDAGARLRVPFGELGVPPEAASSYLFPLRMGRQQAARVLLGSEWVSAAEAVDLGMALRVCPEGTVLEETVALAARIGSFPPGAVCEIKRLMTVTEREAIGAARAREDEAFTRLLGSAANREALDRFNSPGGPGPAG